MQAEPRAATSEAGPDSLVDRKARSSNLDILRAAAAIMVVLHHAYLLQGEGTPFPARGDALSSRWLLDVLVEFLSSGVWLFFALSGYLIAKPFVRSLVRGEPLPFLGSYSVRRAARIFPLYWVALTVTILIRGAASGLGIRYFPFHYGLVHNLVPNRQSAVLGVAWSLTIEVLFYVTVPLVAVLIIHFRKRRVRPATLATLVAFAWLASIVWTALWAMLDFSTTQVWLRNLYPAMFGMFCPGILLAIGEQDLAGSRWQWWLQALPSRVAIAGPVAIVCLAVGGVWTAGLTSSGVHPDLPYLLLHDFTRALFAAGYGIVLAFAIRSRPWGGRLRGMLVGLGLISYGIYLVHAVLLVAFDGPAERFVPLRDGGSFAYAVHAVLLLGLTIPIAWVSWRFFERPILQRAVRFGKVWEARRRGSAVGAPS